MAELHEIASQFFKVVEGTAEGQKALKGKDVNDPNIIGLQDYQFDITDGEPFFLSFQGAKGGGKLSIHRGKTTRSGLWEVTPCIMDTATVLDLFEARILPTEAIDTGRWEDPSGQSSLKEFMFCLITWLIRIGQDEVKKRKATQFDYWGTVTSQ